MYKFIIKPFFDFIVAFILLILLSPIIIFISILLFISNRGSVFFFQKRPGLNKNQFNIIKFKTMIGEFGSPLSDEERLTKIGRFIRSVSIDEILQLINILKGDMSFVGPRPLLTKYLSRYNEEQSKRHKVKPGITGWAQVNGCRGITKSHFDMQNRVNYDLYYIRKWNFWLDIQIILQTIFQLIKGNENVY